MDKGLHETVYNALVRADSANRVAQSCKEAAEAVAYAGDYAGSTWEDAELQRAMRQRARDTLYSLAALAHDAAAAAAEAEADVPEMLESTRLIVTVDKSAAERNAAACAAKAKQCADAWGV